MVGGATCPLGRERHQTARDRKNKYSGRPQLTPIPNVAGIATNATQFRRAITSAKIQIVNVTAVIVRSQTSPLDAAFTCQASTIAGNDQPSA